MTVGEFCTREVVIAEKGESIAAVAQLMRKFHVGDVIIVERQGEIPVPVGIITDRDIVIEVIAQQVDLDAVTAGDVMSYDLFSVTETEGIWETLRQMRGRGIRRIPVVNADGGLEGILAMDDLLDLLAEELTLLVRVIGSGRDRERHKRE